MKNGILWAFRLILAGVFIYAGLQKLADPRGFASAIATFELLPESLLNVVALGLPAFEILAGLLLLVGPWARIGALAIGLMNAVFLVALISALIRGIPVDCGCFGSKGPSTPTTIWLAIGRDIVLLVMSVVIYLGKLRKKPEPMQ